MNYLIFACIGLGIIILILLFMALDRIENSLDYIKGSINNIELNVGYMNEEIYNIKNKFTKKNETGE